MTWIKASERLPEGIVKCRWVDSEGKQIGYEFWTNADIEADIADNLEWLDESASYSRNQQNDKE